MIQCLLSIASSTEYVLNNVAQYRLIKAQWIIALITVGKYILLFGIIFYSIFFLINSKVGTLAGSETGYNNKFGGIFLLLLLTWIMFKGMAKIVNFFFKLKNLKSIFL